MTGSTVASDPGARRPSRPDRRARRRRAVVGLAAVAIVTVVAVAVGGRLTTSGSTKETAPTPSAAPPTSVPTPTTTAPRPADVATTKVPVLEAFDAPGGTRVVASLSDRTDYQQPRTLLVTERQGEWLKALLPIRPNRTEGWIRLSDVTLSQNPYRITVDLGAHTVRLFKDGQELLSSPAVIGADRTPTPLGTYYVTDPVDLRTRSGGPYGAYALGLSGFSEVLFQFNGGPGQIALHGTNNPELVGQSVSNGCVRIPNDVIVAIATQVPLGTPVVIT